MPLLETASADLIRAEKRAYLDTSALAKWYLNEPGSEAFVAFLQGLSPAVISSHKVADLGVSILATADGVMADAVMIMGLQVVRFSKSNLTVCWKFLAMACLGSTRFLTESAP
ncbi:hypothetical protein KBZ15_14075 [Cyanobium sp. BA20m-p-22]|uniref:hypothetical protein n=1 Tax=Cyanobium sp. BA20m-p-22 TaxID=2823704 RepID=UPI0020CCE5E4|nr:hypothetical protein [Cyanobium sp. BA20m-p-22]MCP9911016.1 hypothetical protein [Cyanobium sp. BA20m-p-22]